MKKVTILFHSSGSQPVSLKCEVARSFFEKTKGLMYRSDLSENRGILFPFLWSSYRLFWMKNVQFPLDIIFIDKAFTVRKVCEGSADSSILHSSYWAFGFCKYVIECKRGFCQHNKISTGSIISIEKNDE